MRHKHFEKPIDSSINAINNEIHTLQINTCSPSIPRCD